MKSLALRGPASGERLQIEDGTFPVVVALPYEHISDVINRVQSFGGQANVAIAFSDSFTMITMGQKAVGNKIVEVHQDLSMGMFLIKAQNNPGKTIPLRFRDVAADVPMVSGELAYV